MSELRCGLVVTYDYFLTVSDEVDFVWNHRLGLPKVVFFLSRYLLPATELNWPCSGPMVKLRVYASTKQMLWVLELRAIYWPGPAGCSTEMPYPGLASGSWLTFSVMHVDNYSPFQLQDKPINLSRIPLEDLTRDSLLYFVAIFGALASSHKLAFTIANAIIFSGTDLLIGPTAVVPCIARCKLMKSSGGVSHDYQSFEDGNETAMIILEKAPASDFTMLNGSHRARYKLYERIIIKTMRHVVLRQ
ncbi:hypothetical protein R3P38DRAFT_2796133 [Favolaschia claudopus]|uniref:DUF6533 domain-containing protein n=1 Tax=Favolaschia claudopus TaxID=2862362 RepID=A0AAW0A4E0_9AGAR